MLFGFIRRLFAGSAQTLPVPPTAPGPVFIPGPRPGWFEEAVEAQLERFGLRVEQRNQLLGVTQVKDHAAIAAIFEGDAQRQKADSAFFNGGVCRVSPKFYYNGSVRLPFHKPADHLQ